MIDRVFLYKSHDDLTRFKFERIIFSDDLICEFKKSDSRCSLYVTNFPPDIGHFYVNIVISDEQKCEYFCILNF